MPAITAASSGSQWRRANRFTFLDIVDNANTNKWQVATKQPSAGRTLDVKLVDSWLVWRIMDDGVTVEGSMHPPWMILEVEFSL